MLLLEKLEHEKKHNMENLDNVLKRTGSINEDESIRLNKDKESVMNSSYQGSKSDYALKDYDKTIYNNCPRLKRFLKLFYDFKKKMRKAQILNTLRTINYTINFY